MNKLLLTTAMAAALSCSVVLAQTAPPQSPTDSAAPQVPASVPETPATPSPSAANPAAANSAGGAASSQTVKIAPGTVFPVELTKTIDAKKVKTGDEVVAKVTQDMKTSAGDVIIAKDTRMVGHVTEAQPRTKEQKESEIGITFEKAVGKDGEMKLPMSIQAIIAPTNNTNPNTDSGGAPPSGPATGGSTASAPSSPMGGRTAPADTSSASPNSPSAMSNPSSNPNATAPNGTGNARPQITASTQGVIGMSDVKLVNAQDAAQGSVVSSEKNNVKLESGTMMLLRVNK